MREEIMDNNTDRKPHTDVRDAPISLDDLAVFAAVARAQSFVGAGEALGLDRSRVSRIIGRLEEALGVALFTRTTRTVGTSRSAPSRWPFWAAPMRASPRSSTASWARSGC
jgi:DNA-binding transcriptional LysR family regulator